MHEAYGKKFLGGVAGTEGDRSLRRDGQRRTDRVSARSRGAESGRLPAEVCLAHGATASHEVASAWTRFDEPLKHELLDHPLHCERARGVIGNQRAGGGESFACCVVGDEASKALLDRESCSLVGHAAIVSHE